MRYVGATLRTYIRLCCAYQSICVYVHMTPEAKALIIGFVPSWDFAAGLLFPAQLERSHQLCKLIPSADDADIDQWVRIL